MTNTEAIKLLSRFPKDTPLIIEWFDREDFNAPELLWDKVCIDSDQKLDTSGWNEDVLNFIDFIAENEGINILNFIDFIAEDK